MWNAGNWIRREAEMKSSNFNECKTEYFWQCSGWKFNGYAKIEKRTVSHRKFRAGVRPRVWICVKDDGEGCRSRRTSWRCCCCGSCLRCVRVQYNGKAGHQVGHRRGLQLATKRWLRRYGANLPETPNLRSSTTQAQRYRAQGDGRGHRWKTRATDERDQQDASNCPCRVEKPSGLGRHAVPPWSMQWITGVWLSFLL